MHKISFNNVFYIKTIKVNKTKKRRRSGYLSIFMSTEKFIHIQKIKNDKPKIYTLICY